MKCDYWADLEDEAFALTASEPGDEELLARCVALSGRCSLRAMTWSWEVPDKNNPHDRVVDRADFRLVDDAVFEPRRG
jgi:hypothetical protein